MGPWLVDLESFEQVSQDATSLKLVLRMAQLSREGRLQPFLCKVADDPDFDYETRSAITELGDETFLLAVEEYLGRTRVVH